MSQVQLFPTAMFTQSPRAGRARRGSGARGVGRPSLRLCVLGSGSGGNCTALSLGERSILIDAGFGPTTTRRRLHHARMTLEQVQAICLTHLDQDHFRRSWPATLRRLGIRLFVHHWHLPELAKLKGAEVLFDAGLVDTFDGEPFEPMEGLTGRGVRLQHDLQGTIGYRFEARSSPRAFAGAVGYATDLGHVPPALIDHFAGVDLLCLESNYDERMTIHSSRPTFVNRRNLSDSGHLSNEQAFDAVRRIAAASPYGNPRNVLLMHRSGQCNHPMKVRRVFERDETLHCRVRLTEQRRRSAWIPVKPLRAVQRCQQVLGYKVV